MRALRKCKSLDRTVEQQCVGVREIALGALDRAAVRVTQSTLRHSMSRNAAQTRGQSINSTSNNSRAVTAVVIVVNTFNNNNNNNHNNNNNTNSQGRRP